MKPNFKSLEFIYQDTEIHFLFLKNENIMINATDMAKAFDKLTADFLRLDSTKKYINSYLCYGKSHNINIEDIINVNKKLGTFMIRPLALKFAAWLDPDFELWIFDLIDNLLFKNYNIHRQKTIDIQTTKKELQNYEAEIRSGNFANAIVFLDKQKQLKQLQKDKTNALKNQSKIIQLELF